MDTTDTDEERSAEPPVSTVPSRNALGDMPSELSVPVTADTQVGDAQTQTSGIRAAAFSLPLLSVRAHAVLYEQV